MQISKNAWHYKILMDEMKSKIRNGTSLCKYFWMVVFAMFSWVALGAFGIFIGATCLLLAYWFFYVWYFLISGLMGVESFVVSDIEVSLVLNFMVTAIWSVVIIKRLYDKFKNTEIPKSNNLMVQYIKAKKQKICPIIQFKD